MRNFFKFLILAFVLTVSVLLVKQTSAMTTADDNAKKLGITFPIADLGNCDSLAACKAYCELPENKDACENFARSKGIGQQTNQAQILADAKNQLGCSTIDECKTLCASPDNYDKCKAFAQTHNIGKPPADVTSATILQKAKAALGCDSYEACKAFCTQEANRQKCSEFARSVNIKGGNETKGPGGCTTLETCKAYCSDPNNFKECSSFTAKIGKSFRGPGGCDSPDACRAYCQQHMDVCRQFKTEHQASGSGDFKPKQGTPPGFLNNPAFGNCPNPTACASICRENPAKCATNNLGQRPEGGQFNFGSPRPELPKPSLSPEVHGVKTGPEDDILGTIVNFVKSLF